MKKKLLFPCLFLSALMLLTCVFTLGVGAAETMTMTAVAAGEKTPAAGDIVTIADATELKAFSAYVSAGGTTAGITFKLDDSIAEEGIVIAPLGNELVTNFNPIGGVYNDSTAAPVPFLGTFDGNGKTVSGLIFGDMYYEADGTYKSIGANTENIGFFAVLGEGAVVKDLKLSINGAQNIAGPYFGVLASTATGATVKNCTVNGAATSSYHASNFSAESVVAGGVIGYAVDCTVDACKVDVKINASKNGSAAGVVGWAESTNIRNCVAGGLYTHASGKGYIGGVVAKLDGTSKVQNCYSSAELRSKATSTTSVTNGDILGGVAGYVGTKAVVENCFSDAVVTTKASKATGVLVGQNDGAVKNSYAKRATEAEDAAIKTKPHADIGLNGAISTVENVSAYQAKLSGEESIFVLGHVELVVVSMPCPDCGGSGCPGCSMTDGVIETDEYKFVEASGGGASLVDALNAWVDDNKTDEINYLMWAVSGSTIINCDHNAPVGYSAYPGQAPTCAQTGTGDKYCSICKVVLEKGVEIPADPSKHSQAVYPCKPYECTYCHETVSARAAHKIGDIHCIDQTCSVCGDTVEASMAHTHPEFDEDGKPFDNTGKLCLEYTCAKCGDPRAKDADHTMEEILAPCQEGVVCEVCNMEVEPSVYHTPGRAANCTRDQICLECLQVIRVRKGHTWGDPPTCGDAQRCIDCDAANPDKPATGKHIYDRHADDNDKVPVADCLNNSVCVNCGHVGQKALGHDVPKTSTSCGLGKGCTRCMAVVNPASGDHIVNLDRAAIIRAAADGRSGIVEGICLDCGRKVEAYTTFAVMETTGNVLVKGGNFTFFTGSRVNATFGTVADYQDLEYEKGYIPLQVVTVTLADKNGGNVMPTGGVTIQVALNKSAALVGVESFLLYQVEETEEGKILKEVTVTGVENGFLTFDAESLGTFILVAEEDAAFEAIGAILPEQPQQTAALVGTASYARRDFEA